MMGVNPPLEKTCLILKFKIPPAAVNAFTDWQGELNKTIATFPQFLSLEINSSVSGEASEWDVIQRFETEKALEEWKSSSEHQRCLEELKQMIGQEEASFSEVTSDSRSILGAVTEVFFSQVKPENEHAFREWMAKMHHAEAKFPGFKGVYVQTPGRSKGGNWITLLQFDSPENLDRWLSSKERLAILKEAGPLLKSLDSHRVESPYAGWFSSMERGGEVPPAWKQTMIVLLVLYPLVMLEMKFLSPHLTELNPALATFIGNAISVSLVSWPMVPLAITLLNRWLFPSAAHRFRVNVVGTLFVAALYLMEIILLWKFL